MLAQPKRYALIGAGPTGLAAAQKMLEKGVEFVGFESSDGVGGLWDIKNPRSTVYESAHLISSRTTTEFANFPMSRVRADYPSHRELKEYFDAFADAFDLRDHFCFNTTVERVTPNEEKWDVSYNDEDGEHTDTFDGVILASGTLAHPSVPKLNGDFNGELLHTADYKHPRIFEGKRVLLIGAGNSGCDIAVDAVHYAESVDMSVRRGYYFVPKYMFGKPTDTLTQGKPLPRPLKQAMDSRLLKMFTGKPERFGFPKPRYRIYESHPVVNTLILHHAGQGDVTIRPDVTRFEGRTAHFTDGSRADYDLVMLATGYVLDYPYIEKQHLNWIGACPKLYLNMFTPSFNGIYVLGMIEASGIGWEGRAEQAELLASYLAGVNAQDGTAELVRDRAAAPWPDLTGGYRYLGLDRMSYYVDRYTYRSTVTALSAELAAHAQDTSAPATHQKVARS